MNLPWPVVTLSLDCVISSLRTCFPFSLKWTRNQSFPTLKAQIRSWDGGGKPPQSQWLFQANLTAVPQISYLTGYSGHGRCPTNGSSGKACSGVKVLPQDGVSSSTTLPGGPSGLWLLQGIPNTLPVRQGCEEVLAPKGL